MQDRIDFVIIWVDGNDPAWQAQKRQYRPDVQVDDRQIRYQDWDNLQYWFRGVERFAPWVGKIHFVTWGHLPPWLNTEHPKLNIVRHEDYIPQEYLPTFSSHPIELNLHRIQDLSEKFVYFNDDMFLTAPVKPEDFFHGDTPCDTYRANVVVPLDDKFTPILFNNVKVINRHFHKRAALKQNFSKWVNFKYGSQNLITLALMPWREFTGFHDEHLPNAFQKSLFETVWKQEGEILDATCRHKFRDEEDVSQYLMRYWRLAQGDFAPRSHKFGKLFVVSNDNQDLFESILKRRYHMVCCNDTGAYEDFELQKRRLQEVFQQAFPEKSSFER